MRDEDLRGGLGSQIVALFKGCGLTKPIKEVRGQWFEPVDFESNDG